MTRQIFANFAHMQYRRKLRATALKAATNLLLGVVVASAVGCTHPQTELDAKYVDPVTETDGNSAPLAELRTTLMNDCAEKTFAGVVVVRKNERTLLDMSCNTAIKAPHDRALYKIFSTSKTITAATLLTLIDDGSVEMDSPLVMYLAEIPSTWSDVTIRDLLQHTSGIPDYTEALLLEWTEHGARTHKDAMNHLLGKLARESPPLAAVPGQQWAYSNFGYELIAHIVATIEQKPFDQVVREKIFEPAEMDSAQLDVAERRDDDLLRSRPIEALVQGYNGAAGALEEASSYSFVQLGAGAVLTSATDLTNFSIAMDDSRLISEATWQLALTGAAVVNEHVAYGPGVMLRQRNGCLVLQHDGGSNGFASDFARVPSLKASVVVLSNYGFADVTRLSGLALEALTEDPECSS